jgi:endonuclease-3 related protein
MEREHMIKALEIYKKLRDSFGEPGWWPGEPYEIMVGAVLVQNTAWGNVEKALANFKGRLSPEYVEALPLEKLRELIRPSGFYKAKSLCLKEVTMWYKSYDYSAARVHAFSLEKLRSELLAVKGVGEETADAILLYSFRFPTFVVDAYTRRLLSRLDANIELSNAAIKNFFTGPLGSDAGSFADCHALIVAHAKQYCRKTPFCCGCPLSDICSCDHSQRLP